MLTCLTRYPNRISSVTKIFGRDVGNKDTSVQPMIVEFGFTGLQPHSAMRGDFQTRLKGAAILGIAALLGWRGIWQPLEDARAHEPEIHLSSLPLFLAPALTILGVLALLGGDSLKLRNPSTGRYTRAAWIWFATTLVLSALTFWYLLQVFAAYGY